MSTPHDRDFRVIEGGKLSHEDSLTLAFSDGEPWRTVRAIQLGHLAGRPRSTRDWEHALDTQLDAILAAAERGDSEALQDWLRALSGTAMAWHQRLDGPGDVA